MIGAFIQLEGHQPGLGFVVCENGCHEWTGCKKPNGYGELQRGGKHLFAHRFYYEQSKGPIPLGKQIDHLCRKRDCVNPDHLEAVTQRENLLRGDGFSAECARKTHCPKGHLLSADNLVTWARNNKGRACRTCKNEWQRAYATRKREAK